ncbi:Rho protein GDP-dissociation inhibitor like protein [Aduncisulcus paluster]|uniref:Rho protein GDP-dissociation inhibitor like protein n=1 Tax=Aduncisulcus paluster TaxID=2918883 RepID=A0ABQ5KKF2_9EUKA|nr:Rho protein GDP-dissociation inhibitor like protein [Aduncisulcus paluster]
MSEVPPPKDKDEDFVDESGYKGAAKISMSEALEADKGDEALDKWKAALVADVDTSSDESDPRQVIVDKLVITTDYGAKFEFDLSTEAKVKAFCEQEMAFSLIEGCTYTMKILFHVRKEIVAGFCYVNLVYKGPFRILKEQQMFGSYASKAAQQQFTFPVKTAPKGPLARGKYTAKAKFTDDDKNLHLQIEYRFGIEKAPKPKK